ncbi:MAG TPA: winged helix-turn-helix domain-containing protein [Burkholderiaceae bacterium]|nr:winged helix-turn-helix domain-containing protein [Burkholderiaceae bacterium]
MQTDKRLRFGNCEIFVQQREVWLDGQLQQTPPKVFDLLLHLLRERHRVVQKRELFEALWRRQDVSDGVLARAIMQARKAIGDSAMQPSHIKTVHGHGYRFVGEVFESEAREVRVAATSLSQQPARLRLAVLPCENRTGDPSLDWVRVGLMTLVGHALERDARLEVAPLSSLVEALGGVIPEGQGKDLPHLVLQRLGLSRAVTSWLRRQGHTLWLDYEIWTAGSESKVFGTVRGAEPALIGERFARTIDVDVFPGSPAAVKFESSDPFVNQAFARAIEQYTRSNFPLAVRMMAAVCALEPNSSVAQRWCLRLRILRGDREVRQDTEAMLAKTELWPEPRVRAELHLIAAEAISRAHGALQASRDHLDKALEFAEGQDCGDWVNAVRISAAQDAQFRGEVERARKLYQNAAAGFREAGNPLYQGLIECQLAALAWDGGDVAGAREGYERALAQLRSMGFETRATQALARLALANTSLGQFRLAEAQCREAMTCIGRLPNRQAAASIVASAAFVLSMRGSSSEVENVLKLASGLEHDDHPAVRASLGIARAWFDFVRGDRAAVRRRARMFCEDRCIDHGAARALLVLWLRAEDLAGDPRGIRKARARVRGHLDPASQRRMLAALLMSLATEKHARGQYEAALDLLSELLATKPPSGLDALARLDAAWIHLERGELDAAQSFLADTGEWRSEHPAGLATEARLSFALGQLERAASLQQRAMKTFRGAPPPWHEALMAAYLSCTRGTMRELPRMPRLIGESWFPDMG